MINRRGFLVLGAAAPALAAAPTLGGLKTRRVGRVEIAFKSPPGSKPNGLQATKDGLWMIDQGEGNKAYLVSYEDGKVLRSFATETDRSSGITFDDGTLWIGSTYSREIVRCDAMTGKTLERHFTPGAGVIYKMAGDPPERRSPLAPKQPAAPPKKAEPNADPSKVGGFQAGQLLGSRALGTGAHGQEVRDGKLWMAVPPARMVFCLNPNTWVVERRFETAGNRPHGIGWEGKYLWVADSNWNAFFKHDPETGEMVEKIQLADSDPLPHGMSIWQGTMWYCDDVGVVCRLRM
jgi:streptogramin lyase